MIIIHSLLVLHGWHRDPSGCHLGRAYEYGASVKRFVGSTPTARITGFDIGRSN